MYVYSFRVIKNDNKFESSRVSLLLRTEVSASDESILDAECQTPLAIHKISNHLSLGKKYIETKELTHD